MEKQVFILFVIEYANVKGQVRGHINLKSLSPEINHKLKFKIVEREEKQHYSFDQLRERLKDYYFDKKSGGVVLAVVNQQTNKMQKFGIMLTQDWPEGLTEDKIRHRRTYIEITPHLKKIGILD